MSEKKYIDADKLSKLISETRFNLPHDSKDFFTRDFMLLNFQQTVDLEPAADVAEVVHGKWLEDDYGYFQCSEWGSEHDTPEYTTPFCPLCGAKMDAEQEKNA